MTRTLYTSADDGMPYWKTTRPFLEAYAGKVGASLVVLPKSQRKNPQLALFDAMEDSLRLETEDPLSVSVWMDADIVMTDTAPDLFETPDRLLFCAPDPPTRVHPRWREEFRRYGLLNIRPYPITAMVRWSHRHARTLVDWVNGNQARFPARLDDQSMSAMACWSTETPVNYFPQWWHAMSSWVDRYTQFLHAAGGEKAVKLKRLIRVVETRRANRVPLPDV